MKKIFILTFSLSITAFAYQGCAPVDSSKAWAKADSLANSRLVLLGDSLRIACMNDVMAAATLRADTMMQFAMKKPGSKPPKKPAPKPSGGISDRPGSQQDAPKSISDRKGTIDSTHGPKKISDRQGVNPPPK